MVISSVNPRTGAVEEQLGSDSDRQQVADACLRARDAFPGLRRMGRSKRAALLHAMADGLEARRADIVAMADRESALGVPRLEGELTRTCFQLRFFGEVLADGGYLGAVIDHAGPTDMGPRPDLRRMLIPIGPVAVFAASNFPLAFSVPGGDTAAAIAAGCPVVIKAHPAHPATSRLAFDALVRACASVGAPEGTVELVFGHEAGRQLVQDPNIKAVGFTGSEAGGRALFDLASARPDPIPFYGELGSINPLVVTPAAAARRAAEIAEGYVASITLGAGQFCTKPGLAFVPAAGAAAMRAALTAAFETTGPVHLLTKGIQEAYLEGTRALGDHDGVDLVAGGQVTNETGFAASPALFWTSAAQARTSLELIGSECFGPTGVIVEYSDIDDLTAVLQNLPGTLTASIHAEDGEEQITGPILDLLSQCAGRLIWNGFPTGVAVSWAMTHGGPFPSSTSVLHTSVGAESIKRFLRPVSFQSVPGALLPEEVRDESPGIVPRRVDGTVQP